MTLYDYCVEQKDETLLRQWHPTKNLPLTPESATFGSRKKIWWQCGRGHQWRSIVVSRARDGVGCPVCAGKHKTLRRVL